MSNLNLLVSGVTTADIIELLKVRGTTLQLVQPKTNGDAIPHKRKSSEAKDIIFTALKKAGVQLPRKSLSRTLQTQGYRAASVGPMCTMLQREGRIFSPRRGYWQVK